MILDLFAGAGGWSEGLRELGLADIGIEVDRWACATRAAAGHQTIRADVAAYPTEPFRGRVEGLIASPPCQDFSRAGKRRGMAGDTGRLVYEVMRWATAIRPLWIACEQVPDVLPIWQEFAWRLRPFGYSTWTGILCAADYGVPQTRERAFLLADREGPALPPEPTHCRGGRPADLWGRELVPWVSMAEALGWDGIDRPAKTVAGHRLNRVEWVAERPATTILSTPRIGRPGHKDRDQGEAQFAEQSVRVTVEEAAVLQGFRPDYPWQGTKTAQFRQVGDAVCPPVAAAIVRALMGGLR